jgi:hypothetical protein
MMVANFWAASDGFTSICGNETAGRGGGENQETPMTTYFSQKTASE